jgi:type VI secretion system protein ImpM
MRCGLFGKLPAKRDFVAVVAPRALLDKWEPWMQGSISASRDTLGDNWQQAFLTAPIWRFWLGADICGMTIAGAFMSSLDGVGRYYPLTVFACADPGGPIPPPDIDAHDDWFVATENFLLSTLEKDVSFETVSAALEQLTPPAVEAQDAPPEGMTRIMDGALAAPAAGHSFLELCGSLRTANHASTYAAASFWWTLGGEGYEPCALSCRGMPDPFLFARMLTGRFAATNAQ